MDSNFVLVFLSLTCALSVLSLHSVLFSLRFRTLNKLSPPPPSLAILLFGYPLSADRGLLVCHYNIY